MLTRRIFAAASALIPFFPWKRALGGADPAPDPKITIPKRLRVAPPGTNGPLQVARSDGLCVADMVEDGYLTWLYVSTTEEAKVGILRQFDKETGHLLREQLHHFTHWPPAGFGDIPPQKPVPPPANPNDSFRRVLDQYAKVNQEIGACLGELRHEEEQERQLARMGEKAQKEGRPSQVCQVRIQINGMDVDPRASIEASLVKLRQRCKDLESLLFACIDAAHS
jgi:hypothetical protein